MPIGTRGGFHVQLGRESKARKQFAAKYGRETLGLNVFGGNRRVSEGEINAMILQSLALQGPTWPYDLQTRLKAARKNETLPDGRTFRRHISALRDLGYIKSLTEEKHHAGVKRTYNLTEKGKVVVMFLPDVQRELLKFMNLHGTPDSPATPCSDLLRLMMEHNMPTVASYFVRQINEAILTFDFEEINDDNELWNLRLAAFAGVASRFLMRMRSGEDRMQMLRSVSRDDARRFNELLRTNKRFRDGMRDIIRKWRMAIYYQDQLAGNAMSVLDELEKPDEFSKA